MRRARCRTHGKRAYATFTKPHQSTCCAFHRKPPALQFFIAPLISPDGIARERNAVDSEHSKNLQSDGWRQQQLWKAVANPDHNFARFFTGNAATLGTEPEAQGIDVHTELVGFYRREYSANRMKLCVMGRQPLHELEALVRGKFGSVENKGVPAATLLALRACSAKRQHVHCGTTTLLQGHAEFGSGCKFMASMLGALISARTMPLSSMVCGTAVLLQSHSTPISISLI